MFILNEKLHELANTIADSKNVKLKHIKVLVMPNFVDIDFCYTKGFYVSLTYTPDTKLNIGVDFPGMSDEYTTKETNDLFKIINTMVENTEAFNNNFDIIRKIVDVISDAEGIGHEYYTIIHKPNI